MKTFSLVKSIIFSFVLLFAFFSSCIKEKKADPDLSSNLSSENKIISFELINSDNGDKNLRGDIPGIVVDSDFTVSLKVPSDAIFEGLKVKVVISENASVSPKSGSEVTFYLVNGSNPEVYRKTFKVTAQDGSVQDYTVNITKSLSSDRSITSFVLEKSKNEGKIFADRIGFIDEDATPPTITLNVSDAATLDQLKPTIIKSGNSISPDNEAAVSFTNNSATDYKVTSGDGQEKIYKVTVAKNLSSDNKISAFAFTKDNANNTGLKLSRSSTGTRASDVIITDNSDDRTGTISVKASTAADVAALIPTITTHENVTISPAISAYDYSNSNSKVYTVTAQDGQTREYTVSVSKELSNEKGMKSFLFKDSENVGKNLGGDCSAGAINSTGSADVAVEVVIPNTATLTGLIPTITSSDHTQVSPASEIAQDFTRNTVKPYVVTAQDGTERNYGITIVSRRGVDITSFKIKKSDHSSDSKVRLSSGTEVSGTVLSSESANTVTISLDGQDDNSVNLMPEIVVSPGATVSPNSKVQTEFTYGTAVPYAVRAEDTNFSKTYQVALRSSSKLKSFKFKTEGDNISKGIVKDINGIINGTSITVNVPYDTELNGLIPEVLLYRGARISPQSGVAKNFGVSGSPISYAITAEDGTIATYTITVNKNAEPTISEFKFTTASNGSKNLVNDITGTITGNDIVLKVPYDADISALTPTVTTSSGATAHKGTGTDSANSSNNFTDSHITPKEYSAVNSSGGRKIYNVKVYKAPAITSFKFEQSQNSSASFPTGITEYIASPVTQNGISANGTIEITVANTVDVANLTPSIIVSNETTDPIVTSIDFSNSGNSQAITVVNKHLSGFEKTYTVTVNKEADPVLSGFSINADPSKGIQNPVTGTVSSTGTATGKIVLKFPKNNEHAFDLTGLSYTSAPINRHTLAPSAPLAGSSIDGQTFILTKTDTGSKSIYTVQAVEGPFIKSFKFEESQNSGKGIDSSSPTGTINHQNNTIEVTLPSTVKKDSSSGSTNTVTLNPTIELGGYGTPNVQGASGNSQEFTSGTAVNYTVTANGMTKTYAVTVTREKSTEAQITSFTIDSNSGNITPPGSGNGDKGRIVVPVSTTGIKTPTIVQSEYATVSPSAAQNFDSYENPNTYTVTAEDTSVNKVYEVYIHDSTKAVTIGNIAITSPSAGSNVTSVDEPTRVITVTVPKGTDLSTLTLTFDITSSPSSLTLTVDPAGSNDFSNGAEIKYTLTDTSSGSNVVGHYWVKASTS
ncbi:DUF5018 domain-containing protein [Ichthyobacterium seriolicida]|uniref:Pkd domain containing protein n=1 Tax=Ichthyobacterium seriolicida TaxID=242600 RepID=A0A1J1E3S0_9FLAO|nr:hypothetical protein [Ichthyobacterium seriolicida]BAV94708.1 pkd domain containing protein [Ichthyobacterium seriolicida]